MDELVSHLSSSNQEMLLNTGRAIGRICFDNCELMWGPVCKRFLLKEPEADRLLLDTRPREDQVQTGSLRSLVLIRCLQWVHTSMGGGRSAAGVWRYQQLVYLLQDGTSVCLLRTRARVSPPAEWMNEFKWGLDSDH